LSEENCQKKTILKIYYAEEKKLQNRRVFEYEPLIVFHQEKKSFSEVETIDPKWKFHNVIKAKFARPASSKNTSALSRTSCHNRKRLDDQRELTNLK
jgi:hypothetical protein